MNGFQSMSFNEKVDVYRQFDEARHEELEKFARDYQSMQVKLAELVADLDDERKSRRSWRQQAEVLQQSVERNRFAVVLIDGDGYLFNRTFYMNSHESGGAQAAHTLYTDVQQHLKANSPAFNGDMEVMVILCFNKQVPARALVEADIIQRASQLDDFFWSFTSSRSLFQVIDCGPGKERADSKLRDTYRFYLNSAQCEHIFLACCHDNGYVAELDKYRHDPRAAEKTVLIKHGNTANQFYNLNLPFTRFSSTFEMEPLQAVRRAEAAPAFVPSARRVPSADDSASQNSGEGTPATTWSTVTAGASRMPDRTRTSIGLSASAETFEPGPKVSSNATGDPKAGIPVNRVGQRIDRTIRPPAKSEIDRFQDRIADQKLCNTHHLTSAGCFAYKCNYDHEPVDAAMKHTLKYKARSIPCTTGSKCRKAECFYGHQCPWGMDRCTNDKCPFYRNNLHDIHDLEIAKFVPANAA
ncbi:hypothetical protein LTR70_003264 [Exophiala xenobiotica]|uniref:C3H1-type domain-containing protein n=1 Tax=Lithohypha guttulata TaxID=1690604 RepID=A0ABR0KLJ6_9EURO|nr:hypothetical protein LTR24_001139 [Lithohypha guttulata]KAK5323586.1 hypothetical protein LTR70_003264 [Exophiala xenobiotica]